MKKIIYIICFLLLCSCDSVGLGGVTSSDVRKACAQIASSSNYEKSLRLNIIHELDEKAGRDPTSSFLVDFKIDNMKIATQMKQMNGYANFEYECYDILEEEYLR